MSSESDFDPNDVAEEYELDAYEAGAEEGEEFDNEAFGEENDGDLPEMENDAAAFEGFEDSGEPATFNFQVHNGKKRRVEMKVKSDSNHVSILSFPSFLTLN